MCRMFPTTLTDCTKAWFRKLPSGSVDSFTKLTMAFCAQFQGIRPRPKDPILLQYVTQERGETLRSYVEKYHREVIQMGVFDERETLANFRRNLWMGKLFRSFAKHPPKTYQEAYNRALEQIDIEEQLRVKMDHDESRSVHHSKKEVPKPPPIRRFQNPPPNRSTYRPIPVPHD